MDCAKYVLVLSATIIYFLAAPQYILHQYDSCYWFIQFLTCIPIPAGLPLKYSSCTHHVGEIY